MSRVEPLTYDDTPRRRRWSAKWLVMLGLLTAVVAGWRWWPLVYYRLCYSEKALMLRRISLAPDSLIATADGKLAQSLPKAWVDYTSHGYIPWGNILLFSSDLVSPKGTRRFVLIDSDLQRRPYKSDLTFDLSCEIIEFKYSFWGVLRYGFYYPRRQSSPGNGLTYYAGVADPADRSHFTIRYSVDRHDRFVDGYLMDDGTVHFDLRPSTFPDGPTTSPAEEFIAPSDE